MGTKLEWLSLEIPPHFFLLGGQNVVLDPPDESEGRRFEPDSWEWMIGWTSWRRRQFTRPAQREMMTVAEGRAKILCQNCADSLALGGI
jgi:hypothetical protein